MQYHSKNDPFNNGEPKPVDHRGRDVPLSETLAESHFFRRYLAGVTQSVFMHELNLCLPEVMLDRITSIMLKFSEGNTPWPTTALDRNQKFLGFRTIASLVMNPPWEAPDDVRFCTAIGDAALYISGAVTTHAPLWGIHTTTDIKIAGELGKLAFGRCLRLNPMMTDDDWMICMELSDNFPVYSYGVSTILRQLREPNEQERRRITQ